VSAPGGTSGTYVLMYAIAKDGKILIDGIAELTELTST
jgi:hypothetical protein